MSTLDPKDKSDKQKIKELKKLAASLREKIKALPLEKQMTYNMQCNHIDDIGYDKDKQRHYITEAQIVELKVLFQNCLFQKLFQENLYKDLLKNDLNPM